MTDLLQEVINFGFSVTSIPIHGGWVEVDTVDDLIANITLQRLQFIESKHDHNGTFFSDKYVNEHSKSNIIIYLFSRFAYPFSVLLVKLRLTPNQITTFSTLMALGAAVVVALDGPWSFFVLLWFLSALLDFCDGTAARITHQVRSSSFRYDHNSDLFKIFVIVLAVSIKYNLLYLWIMSSLFIFLLMLYQLLNHDCDFASKMNNKRLLDTEPKDEFPKEAKYLDLKKWLRLYLKDSHWLKILVGLNAVFYYKWTYITALFAFTIRLKYYSSYINVFNFSICNWRCPTD